MNDGTDYRAILLAGTPLIDVRAPVEFQQGAMPGAINLPLMNDDERAAVGTCYKRQGPEAALALGHQLVCGETRQQRMRACRTPVVKILRATYAARAAASVRTLCSNGCTSPALTIR